MSSGIYATESSVLNGIKGIVGGYLHLADNEIDINLPFLDLGADSIAVVEVVRDINKNYGVEVEAADMYDYNTVAKLSEYVYKLLTDKGQEGETAAKDLDGQDLKKNAGNLHSATIQKALNIIEGVLKKPTQKPEVTEMVIKVEKQLLVGSADKNRSFDKSKLESRIKEMLKGVSILVPEYIHSNMKLYELGVDFIAAAELLKQISDEFNIGLTEGDIYDDMTIDQLEQLIEEEVQKSLKGAGTSETLRVGNADSVQPKASGAWEAETLHGISPGTGHIPLKLKKQVEPTEPQSEESKPSGKILLKKVEESEKTTSVLSGAIPDMQERTAVGKQECIPEVSSAGKEQENKKADAVFTRSGDSDGIAVIGMAGRFPGAENIEEFWNNLKNSVSSISELPDSRWSGCGERDEDDKVSRWMGRIDGVDRFDPLFFNISPKEAEVMDPQQRIFLEEAYKALEASGYSNQKLSGLRCGVFAGATQGDYNLLVRQGGDSLTAQFMIGSSTAILPARISYYLNLTGPSIAVDSACSSSLIAVQLACRSIMEGECDMALAGGVYIQTTPDMHTMITDAGMISPDGRCKTFDNSANGFVPGEGAGVVVLKRLDRAIIDKDNIYGVIKGTGSNQDGATNGITAPSVKSQAGLEEEVYKKCNISPDTITYIEAHGTGTKLGDPIEIKALTSAFRKWTYRKQYCAIGSVKTNIGHLLSAAGAAGLIKVLLCLHNKKLVPSLNYVQQNENIKFSSTPFFVSNEYKDWQVLDGLPRRAAISAFGFSGTNCHMVLEEAPPTRGNVSARNSTPGYLVLISTKTKEALQRKYCDLAAWIKNSGSKYSIADIVYTLQCGRSHYQYRACFFAEGIDDTREILELLADGKPYEGLISGENFLENNKQEYILKELSRYLVNQLRDWEGLDRDTYREKLLALAELYCKGYEIDWEGLYGNKDVCRILLPTYPFERESYWVQSDVRDLKRRQIPVPHIMLHSNQSTMHEQLFCSNFSGKEFYLKDHVIGGMKILPAVAYLEMMRAAGELSLGSERIALEDVVWERPFILRDGGDTVYTRLIVENGKIRCEIGTQSNGKESIVCCRGVIVCEDSRYTKKPGELRNIAQIKDRCKRYISDEKCYLRFADLGVEFGRGMRAIREIFHNGDGEVLSTLKLPQKVKNRFNSYILHPSMLDGAVTSAIAFLGDDASIIRVPYSVGRVEIFETLKEHCYAYIKIMGESKVDNETLPVLSIELLDEEGQVLVRLNRVISRPFYTSDKMANSGRQETQTLFLRETWKENMSISTGGAVASAHTLIFDHSSELQSEMAAQGASNVVLVTPGAGYAQLSENSFVINPESIEDYRMLFLKLDVRSNTPESIIHRWSLKPGFNEISINSLFCLAKTISTNKIRHKINIVFMYSLNDIEMLPYYEAVSGFAKALKLESPNLNCKAAGVYTPLVNSRELEFISRLLEEKSGPSDYKLENGIVYSKFIERFEAEKETDHRGIPPVKNGGVYLITGGAGSLGRYFAREMSSIAKITVILLGRTAAGNVDTVKLEAEAGPGAEILYMQCDVTRAEEVDRLVKAVKGQWGRIDGILHAAGVTNDSLLINKNLREWEAVLSAKVHGTVNLDKATCKEKLDFFILFSSIASIIGNIGQTDYSYANSFLNAFAGFRESLRAAGKRSGRTVSICWPEWENGGMKISEAARNFYRERIGFRPLDNKTGWKAFLHGLAYAGSHFAVIRADKQKFAKILLELQNGVYAFNSDIQPVINYDAGKRGIKKGLVHELKMTISNMMKIGYDRLNENAEFSSFGFNSISLTDLASEINKKFGISITPAAFFESPNIAALSGYMINNYHDRVMKMVEGNQENIEEDKSAEWIEEKALPEQTGESKHQKAYKFISTAENREPIAIIGMNGIFPGAEDLEGFWENLMDGHSSITEIPQERWNWRDYYGDPMKEANKTDIIWGGFISSPFAFDAKFFGISPREAEWMDPQQRIFLETVWRAVEDGGYSVSSLGGRPVGVFAGVSTSDYNSLLNEKDVEVEPLALTGNAHSIISNRVSYLLNLKGPSEAVDTACSSALVALKRAVDALRNNECEMAVVGGVNILLSPKGFVGFSKSGFLSKSGSCKTFDADADGYVRGEGAGAILIKPLSKAKEDKNFIYAVIRSISVNHGGRATSLTAPNASSQAEVIMDAVKDAGIPPETITYIETHGTGTKLGDPTEINGLKKAFGSLLSDKGDIKYPFCGLGSVKTNIGHLEPAAGIAGIIKTVLALRHKKIPQNINFNKLNPYIELEESPFYIVTEAKEWESRKDIYNREIPRRAGVSSFGFGGTNAHVVLEEYKNEELQTGEGEEAYVIPLSARDDVKLRENIQNLLEYLNSNTSGGFSDQYREGQGYDKTVVMKEILEMAASVIGVSVDMIDPKEDMVEMGFDHVAASSFADRLNEKYEIRLTYDFILRNQTIEKLVQAICDRIDCSSRNVGASCHRTVMKGTDIVPLRDIAYTLQVGRDGMEERVAFIASGIPELKERINKYLDGATDFEHSFHSKSKTFASEPGQAYVQEAIFSKSLVSIAKLWVSGCDIDWGKLYKGILPRRIPLPAYPFAKETCFRSPALDRENGGERNVSCIHPLVHRNMSTLSLQKFRTSLNGEEFFIKDHVVSGKKVMPGVAYIEMARSAGEFSCNSPVQRISNILWLVPLVFDKSPMHYDIEIFPQNEILNLEVNTVHKGKKIVHMRGELDMQTSRISPENEYIDIGFISEGLHDSVNVSEYYDRLEEHGLKYGLSFRLIKKMQRNEREVLSCIEVSEAVARAGDGFCLHPGIMDCMLQTVTGLLSMSSPNESSLLLPFSLDELKIFAPSSEAKYIYASVADDTKGEPIYYEKERYDITLLDADGKILVEMRGFAVRPVQRLKTRHDSGSLPYCYGVCWDEEALGEYNIGSLDSGAVLVFGSGQYSHEADFMGALKNAVIINISQGQAFQRISRYSFEINSTDEADYIILMEILLKDGIVPSKVLHLWQGADGFNSQNPIFVEYSASLLSMAYIVKALATLRLDCEIRLMHVYELKKDGSETPYCSDLHSSLDGFASSMHFELPDVRIATLGLENIGQHLDVVLKELSKEKFGYMCGIKYEKGKRLVNAAREIEVHEAHTQLGWIKDGGVYLLSGGMGGIGAAISRHIVKAARVKLVLIGRSKLSSEKESVIKELSEFGSEVSYLQGDITIQEDIIKIYKAVKDKYGEINGIINMAGITKDLMLINKTTVDINAVVYPKVIGTLLLDKAFKEEKLDFFMLFSSTVAITGNPGQTDYAYANSFLGHFTNSRENLRSLNKRHGRTICIYWPLWADGGMQIGENRKKWLAEVVGILPISNEQGMVALEYAFKQPYNNILVIEGEKGKMEGWFISRSNKNEVGNGGSFVETTGDFDMNSNLKVAELKKLVKNILSEVLKTAPEEIDDNRSFDELGMNSIFILNINQEFEKGGIKLPITKIFELKTVEKLVKYIMDNKADVLQHGTASGFETTYASELHSMQDMHKDNGSREQENISIGKLNYINMHNPASYNNVSGNRMIKYMDLNISRILTIPSTLKDFVAVLKNVQSSSRDGLLQQASRLLGSVQRTISTIVETETGEKVEVVLCGTGKPVVLICGVGTTAPIWYYQLRDLSKKYQLIVIHQPGHGDSSMIDDLSFQALAQLTMKVVKKLGISSPLPLIGLSMGGMVAQCIAALYPEMVSHLILIGTSYRIPQIPVSLEKVIIADFEAVYNKNFLEISNSVKKYKFDLVMQSSGMSVSAFLSYTQKITQNFSIKELSSRIKAPTMVVTGEKDEFFEHGDSKALSQIIPNAELWAIPNAGHFPPLTHYKEFNRRVSDFLDTY